MTLDDLDKIDRQMAEQARRSFWAYRQYMSPKLLKGWWQRKMAHVLQQFYFDLVNGLRPKLAIQAPPQNGKSKMVIDFVTWVAGHNPDIRTIYTSFSERLGVRANLNCQRIYDSEKYKKVFPETKINAPGMRNEETGGATRNREMLEYIGHEGYFRNTTVRGPITGESLDLGVIDDPIKGREEAGSETVRENTWAWFTDDFFSRFSDEAGLLLIMTRWHTEDPLGKMIKHFGKELKVVSYPAIATEDEEFRKAGEALFPELKSLDFLLERKAVMASANWEALYQQNPQIVGGEIIKTKDFKFYTVAPKILQRSIYADTAMKTAERNDYSVFQCWGKGDDGRAYLIDMIRGKWEAPELERRAKLFWAKHKEYETHQWGQLRKMKIEDKASGTGLVQKIRSEASIPVEGVERTKDKYTRVLDVLGYIESGYVVLPENAPFTADLLAECEAFTADDSHLHDDQIDPMTDAINDLLVNNTLSMWAKLGQ